MAKRKTIKIAALLEMANFMLSREGVSQEAKSGISSLIEKVLLDSGNYAGFGYSFDWNKTPEHTRREMEYNRQYYISRTLAPEYRKLAEERAVSSLFQ